MTLALRVSFAQLVWLTRDVSEYRGRAKMDGTTQTGCMGIVVRHPARET